MHVKKSVLFVLTFYVSLLVLFLAGSFFAIRYAAQYIEQSYPNDLVLEYANGKMQAKNGSLPFTAKVGDNNLLTIREDGVSFGSESNESISYKDFLPATSVFSVNKETLHTTLFSNLVLFSLAGVSLGFLLLLFMRTIELLFYALIIQNLGFFMNKQMPYKKSLQLGLHLLPVAEIVNVLYLVLYRSTVFPMFDVAFLLLAIVVMRAIKVER